MAARPAGPKLSGDRSKAEKLAQWFNTAAFAQPPLYTFGNAGRTDGYGPGAINMDLSVLKDASFDVVWHCHSLVFVDDARRVLTEVGRVLAPGGTYVLSTMHPTTLRLYGTYKNGGWRPKRLERRRKLDRPEGAMAIESSPSALAAG